MKFYQTIFYEVIGLFYLEYFINKFVCATPINRMMKKYIDNLLTDVYHLIFTDLVRTVYQ
jgi:F0F1-type ATP synthase membrane subunit b/b'